MVAHMVQVVYYAVTWATFKPKIKNKKIRPEKKKLSQEMELSSSIKLNKTF